MPLRGEVSPEVNRFKQVFSVGYQMSLGGDQVNKFEQFSSVGHQMSVVRPRGPTSECPGGSRSDVWGLGWGRALYIEVQGIMGNGHK